MNDTNVKTTASRKKRPNTKKGQRHSGPNIRKVAIGSFVTIRERDGQVTSGWLSYVGHDKEDGMFVKVRGEIGLGETVIIGKDFANVRVDTSKGIKTDWTGSGRPNQKLRIMARYGEL